MKQRKGTLEHPQRRTARRRTATLVAGAGAIASVACVLAAQTASAEPALQDYHYFRALSIDLQGRVPSRTELAAFEKPGFDLDGWIDSRLDSPLYAERVSRIYLDLLRLELNSTVTFRPQPVVLRRTTVHGPAGESILVYFRAGQRRARVETDGVFCFTVAESGLVTQPNGTQAGTPKNLTQKMLDDNTTVVKPWWLYRDYSSATPKDLYDPATWAQEHPGYQPGDALVKDADGQPATQVRVCKEEALTKPTGTVFATGLVTAAKPGDVPPYGRLVQLPRDSKFAQLHAKEPIACGSATAHTNSADCGCGEGLERCVPGATDSLDPAAFVLPTDAPLGRDMPFASSTQAGSEWTRQAWSVEAVAFITDIVAKDRDFRDMLLSKATVVNGPAAQFHKFFAAGGCCNDTATAFSYAAPTLLTDGSAMPSLLPHDTNKYVRVEDRGPLASGLLTMPIFLTKYGTRRARAHILYNAFLCKDFVSANSSLMPSQEPDLTKRSGCKDCHATLEPMSAYFSRIRENDWVYLPPDEFPVKNPICKSVKGVPPTSCKGYYDPAFATDSEGMLRGAYSSPENADAGPAALAASLVKSDDFATCVVKNVASSFLGRSLDVDDVPMEEALTKTFVDGGFHLKALVRAMLKSDVYRLGNDRLNAEGQ